MSTLLGEYYNAQSLYDLAGDLWPKNETKEKERLKLFEIVNKVLSFKKFFNPENESSIVSNINWLHEQAMTEGNNEFNDSYYYGGYYYLNRIPKLSAFLYVRSQLASVYASKGEFIKMHLLLGDSHFNYDLKN